MAELFASGRLVDFVLIVVVLEAAGLFLLWRHSKQGIAPFDLLPNLCAGTFLLLALRATLARESWMMACGYLVAAGAAHLIDVRRRWRK
jgi:hypothetical protein